MMKKKVAGGGRQEAVAECGYRRQSAVWPVYCRCLLPTVSFLLFFFTSCKFLEPTIGEFNVKNMEPKSEEEFIIEVAVEVDNPNTFNIWLKKGKMDIIMGKQKMGTLVTVGKVVLKKKTKDYYTISCLAKLDPGSALLGMLTGLTGNNNKPVTFKGSIRGGDRKSVV